MVGIPAAASTQEFETFRRGDGYVVTSGISQLEYLRAAMRTLRKSRVGSNPRFLGTALWAFATEIVEDGEFLQNDEFLPSMPLTSAVSRAILRNGLCTTGVASATGYLSNCSVVANEKGDYAYDAGAEGSSVSSTDGTFELPGPPGLDGPARQLWVEPTPGCNDSFVGLPLALPLVGGRHARVVSPLTTLALYLVSEQNMTQDEADQKIWLESGLSLEGTDPVLLSANDVDLVNEALDGDAEEYKLAAAHMLVLSAQLMTVATLAEALPEVGRVSFAPPSGGLAAFRLLAAASEGPAKCACSLECAQGVLLALSSSTNSSVDRHEALLEASRVVVSVNTRLAAESQSLSPASTVDVVSSVASALAVTARANAFAATFLSAPLRQQDWSGGQAKELTALYPDAASISQAMAAIAVDIPAPRSPPPMMPSPPPASPPPAPPSTLPPGQCMLTIALVIVGGVLLVLSVSFLLSCLEAGPTVPSKSESAPVGTSEKPEVNGVTTRSIRMRNDMDAINFQEHLVAEQERLPQHFARQKRLVYGSIGLVALIAWGVVATFPAVVWKAWYGFVRSNSLVMYVVTAGIEPVSLLLCMVLRPKSGVDEAAKFTRSEDEMVMPNHHEHVGAVVGIAAYYDKAAWKAGEGSDEREEYESVLMATFTAALKVVPTVLVASNGNTDMQKRAIIEVARRAFASQQWPKSAKIIVYHMHGPGNKTISLYMATRWLYKNMDVVGLDSFDYIIPIDDDTPLPLRLRIPKEEFEDGSIQAAAVCIKAQGPDALCVHYQALEYLLVDQRNMVQAEYGSVMAHHGCISIWHTPIYLKMLAFHDTIFDGEDLTDSVIPHLRSHIFPNFSMGLVSNVLTPTLCPDNWKVLTRQREYSWGPVEQKFFLRYIRMLFFCSKKSMSWKPFLLLQLWTLIYDWIRYPFYATMVYMYLCDQNIRPGSWWRMAVAQMALLAMVAILLCIFNFAIIGKKERVPLRAVLTFPLYQGWYQHKVRLVSAIRQVFVVYPGRKPEETIGERRVHRTLPTAEAYMTAAASDPIVASWDAWETAQQQAAQHHAAQHHAAQHAAQQQAHQAASLQHAAAQQQAAQQAAAEQAASEQAAQAAQLAEPPPVQHHGRPPPSPPPPPPPAQAVAAQAALALPPEPPQQSSREQPQSPSLAPGEPQAGLQLEFKLPPPASLPASLASAMAPAATVTVPLPGPPPLGPPPTADRPSGGTVAPGGPPGGGVGPMPSPPGGLWQGAASGMGGSSTPRSAVRPRSASFDGSLPSRERSPGRHLEVAQPAFDSAQAAMAQAHFGRDGLGMGMGSGQPRMPTMMPNGMLPPNGMPPPFMPPPGMPPTGVPPPFMPPPGMPPPMQMPMHMTGQPPLGMMGYASPPGMMQPGHGGGMYQPSPGYGQPPPGMMGHGGGIYINLATPGYGLPQQPPPPGMHPNYTPQQQQPPPSQQVQHAAQQPLDAGGPILALGKPIGPPSPKTHTTPTYA